VRPHCRVHLIISAAFLAVFATKAWGIEQRVQLETTTGTKARYAAGGAVGGLYRPSLPSKAQVVGELAVLCGIPRSASVRATRVMDRRGFRSLLLRDGFFLQRIFRESLHTLIEKERSLIDSLIHSQGE
jgi:hypothetical protein